MAKIFTISSEIYLDLALVYYALVCSHLCYWDVDSMNGAKDIYVIATLKMLWPVWDMSEALQSLAHYIIIQQFEGHLPSGCI